MSEGLLHLFTSLGSAVIISIWQSGLIWLSALLFIKLNKKISCENAGAIAFIATIAGFISFLAAFIYTFNSSTESSFLFKHILLTEHLQSFLPFIAIVYILFFILHIIKILTGLSTIHILKNKNLSKVPGHIKIFTLDAKSYLGIKRKVKIFFSGIVSSPLTVGFLKPIILLPVAILNNLSTQQVESIILHELAHIKRNDYLKNFINRIILTTMYFNPFMNALVKMQDIEREKSADEWVMRFAYNKTLYASALFSLATLQSGLQQELAVAAASKNPALLQRIEWLLGNRKRNFPDVKKIIASGLLILAFLIFSIQKFNAPLNQNIGFALPEKTLAAMPVVFNPQPENIENKVSAKQTDSKTPTQKKSEIQLNNKEEQNAEPIVPSGFQAVSAAVPVLSETEEKNIQASVNATKKILAEANWQQIELQLAETMIEEQKLNLKKLYDQYINQAEWKNMENKLRLNYKNIDWDKATVKLDAAIRSIRLDSIYKNYSVAFQNLSELRKDFAIKDSLSHHEYIIAIDKKLAATKEFINYVDSLRHKRIVEL